MKQRWGSKQVDMQNRGSRRVRLVMEPLEARRLLAGINVSVYQDQTGERVYQQSTDELAADRLVYVDLNLNGRLDSDEPLRVTDLHGEAFFEDLQPGDYSIGIITNPLVQSQSSPVRVEGIATALSYSGAVELFTSQDLSHVWTVNDFGDVEHFVDGEPVYESINLGGRVVFSTRLAPSEYLAVIDSSQFYDEESLAPIQEVVRLNTESAQLDYYPIDGLQDDENVVALTMAGDNIYGLVQGPSGNNLAALKFSGDFLVIEQRLRTTATQIAGSDATGQLLVVQPGLVEGTSQLILLDPLDSFDPQATLTVDGQASSLNLSADGALAFVAMAGGGVQAIAVGPDFLSLAALLNEATAPVSADATDGRIVTASVSRVNELVVWDTTSWLPVGRTRIAEGSRVAGRARLATDRRGDNLVVVHADGVHQVDLSIATTHSVSLSQDDIQSIAFGVVPIRENTPPIVPVQQNGHLVEDTVGTFNIHDAGQLSDPDGDQLWFSLATQARHGVVELTPSGLWTYRPNPNFYGRDRATVHVLDGQSRTELQLEILVQPQNDNPISITFDVPTISESVEVGAELGFVSIVDVDPDASYQISASDPRFRVENGRLYLASGSLDFETESQIVVEFVATDLSDPEISIRGETTLSIGNVNERPTAIRLSNSSVSENAQGAEVGDVIVEDPDVGDQYEITVSDARFVVEGGKLKLANGQSLDFESEPEVTLTITAREIGGQQNQLTEIVRVSVTNGNDAPLSLTISALEIEANMPGAHVGLVSVNDPDNDPFLFTVSDQRFEVQGNLLKLKSTEAIDRSAEPSIPLVVTAISGADRVSRSVSLTVTPARSPYQNRNNPNDVNGDGLVTPLDVLILINYLNSEGFNFQPPIGSGGEEGGANYFDVNGDQMLTPADVLIIINFLNSTRDPAGPTGEGEGGRYFMAQDAYADSEVAALVALPFSNNDESRRKQRIDAELETLLDQLSRERI
ncbi:MAG: cadherin-like domain-containing protein [Planctomycetales bacterium]|nr:cadherin-like domain-containing protein [Planctomycetales bacterium]